jgi:hypothetical protein
MDWADDLQERREATRVLSAIVWGTEEEDRRDRAHLLAWVTHTIATLEADPSSPALGLPTLRRFSEALRLIESA